jgi:hypothetical protein
MAGLRMLWIGVSVLFALGALASQALANPAPPPDIIKKRENPPQIDPKTDEVVPVKEARPRRTGPFRSCGSGMGLGLAGIGIAWGLMWAGTRYAGRFAAKRDQ